MKAFPYSCEKSCPCPLPNKEMPLVVITGGPGAGKTALIEFLRKVLCQHVAVLPEAASLLFAGGFWRMKSPSAQMAAQRAIYHVQNEMQSLVIREGAWGLGICDRGTLDGLAYWPGNPSDYCRELNTTIEDELKKYKAVIHLNSPGRDEGYNHQNPLRTESPEEALLIDRKIHEVWKSHPNYSQIPSTENFLEKVQKATLLVYSHLPDCCRQNLKEQSG